MANVGSYLLSFQDRYKDIDVTTAPARVLKLLGRTPVPFSELLSRSGFPEPFLRAVVEELREKELVAGNDNGLVPTPLGYRAQLVVSS
jgi:hypothetical protein